MVVTVGAYLDESIGAKAMAVGGWVAPPDRWQRFHEDWRAILDREGVSVIGSADLIAGKTEPFRGWPQEKRNSVLAECVSLIQSARVATIWVAILFDEFYAALGSVGVSVWEQRLRDQNCYALCGIACLALLSQWVERFNGHAMVAFEKGMKGFGKIERYLRHVQNGEPAARNLSLISPPRSKAEVIEFQSADFMARAGMRHASRLGADGSLPEPERLHWDLIAGLHKEDVLGGYWDQAKIARELRTMLRHDSDSAFNRTLLATYDPDDDP